MILAFSFLSAVRGLIGILVIIAIAYLFSEKKSKVNFKAVGIGLGIQLLLAYGVLYSSIVQAGFEFVGGIFVAILDYTKVGSEFLFGSMLDVGQYGYIFALQILPTIIFFSALTSVLFYFGIIQKVVYVLALGLSKSLGLGGAESLSVAGNIFLGQTESPLLIKEYLGKMNRSELFLVMVGGMATVAGGVLAAYIGFLGGDDPAQREFYAKHLLTASVMAAPGAILISKILVPQTEKIDSNVSVSKEKVGANFLDALTNGTTEGLKLAMNVGAMLLVFFAVIALVNSVFTWTGDITGLNTWVQSVTGNPESSFNLEFILGYGLSPLMYAIGVDGADITLAGRVLGEKLIASEFVGYASLAELKSVGAFASEKSIIMSTYMLCGFANFASIGIQIGGIGSLAPEKKPELAKLGFKAVLGGTLASLLSAAIVGGMY